MPYLVAMSSSFAVLPTESAARRHIAIDLGASSGRVMEVRVGDSTLAVRELHRFANAPVWRTDVGGRWCWDVDSLWRSILDGLRIAAREGSVDSIAVDAWAVDYALLDRAGQLVQPVAAYRDTRTQKPFAEIRSRLGDSNIYRDTGIAFQPFNTLYQLAADATDPARPLERARYMLMIPDLIAYWLCGAVVSERTNASTTQMLDAHTQQWSGSLCDAVGIPSRILPELVDAGRPLALGTLRAEVARDTGLPSSTQVFATATHDTASAVVAAPIDPAHDLYVSSGTWSLVGAELPHAILTDAAREANMTNELGAFGTVRFLRNVAGMWLVQQCESAFASEGRARSWSELSALAAAAPALASVIDPNDRALFELGDMPTRIRALCAARGERVPQTDGEIIRCALESVALATARAAQDAARIASHDARRLIVVGGGSANAFLNQLIADASGLPVESGPVECTAIGNALMQHAAMEGLASAGALRSLIRTTTVLRCYEPSAAESMKMREASARVWN